MKECIDELDSQNRLMLMAGAGAESTLETKNICEAMGLAGADCLLVVTPSFYKNAMSNAALIKHFTEVCCRKLIHSKGRLKFKPYFFNWIYDSYRKHKQGRSNRTVYVKVGVY